MDQSFDCGSARTARTSRPCAGTVSRADLCFGVTHL
jgi:hypothetical protein